jgi:ribose transport system permease protein
MKSMGVKKLQFKPHVLTPIIVLSLTLAGLLAVPLYSSVELRVFDGYNTLQNFAGFGLIALGVGLTMIVGELDFSAAGMSAFAAMLAASVGAQSATFGVLIAILFALGFGGLQGFIVAKTKISSLPVTIAGFFVLMGAVGVVGDQQSVRIEDPSLGVFLDEQIAEFFSARSLIVIVLFVLVGLTLTFTKLGRDVRAVGGDRTAARTAGVRVDGVLVAIFMTSSALSAIGGIMLSFSLGVAQANVSLTPLILAVTAAIVGGVSLSGGRGGAAGIAAGAFSLALLQQIFAVLASPSYLQNVIYGALLFIAVTSDASGLRKQVGGLFTRVRLRRRRELSESSGETFRKR